ncbi:YaiI/YqxD family protein [Xanthobacter sp. KR7-225]|uniref:YaiI/YqxD family protein n=1 Tax=Xanthobacter sp. KR7-225 TaxID=3156613 RepID=UPI0032B5A9D8
MERLDPEPPSADAPVIRVFIDADACPVKQEAYKVALRHGVPVIVVANAPIAVPRDPLVSRAVVPASPDAADDFIAERARRGDVVVTADIPLAARCVKAGADVIAPSGRPFTTDSIGLALATRNLFDELRSQGTLTSGPKPFSPRERSAFLSALDLAIVRLKRAGFRPAPV